MGMIEGETAVFLRDEQEKEFLTNLHKLESLCPRPALMSLTYTEDPKKFPNIQERYLPAGLREVCFIPDQKDINFENLSIVLYRTRTGLPFHFLVTNKPDYNQEIVGLPDAVRYPSRPFWGVRWERAKDGTLSCDFESFDGESNIYTDLDSNFVKGLDKMRVVNIMSEIFLNRNEEYTDLIKRTFENKELSYNISK